MLFPLAFALVFLVASLDAAEAGVRKFFDLPASPAPTALKQFISQSGVQLLYAAKEISGVTTNPVRGHFTASEAVKRLLADTGLIAIETENGAIAVNRVPLPNAQWVAQK